MIEGEILFVGLVDTCQITVIPIPRRLFRWRFTTFRKGETTDDGGKFAVGD
jgi:hypothetical protein